MAKVSPRTSQRCVTARPWTSPTGARGQTDPTTSRSVADVPSISACADARAARLEVKIAALGICK